MTKELPPMKQQITVSGRNWNDIVQLPCFRGLTRDGAGWQLLVHAGRADGQDLGYEDDWYGVRATVGDTLTQYADGTWEVRHQNR